MEAYDNMLIEDLDVYEDFKADILMVYELRAEAYRLKFRGGKKRPGDSCLECARYLEQAFKRWTTSEDLMVMEQLINVADKELVPLLREKQFKTLKKAATWADDHVLAHRPEPRVGDGAKECEPRGPALLALPPSPGSSRGRWQCQFWSLTFPFPQLRLWQ